MSRKMEGYKRGGEEPEAEGEATRDSRVPMPTHRRARL